MAAQDLSWRKIRDVGISEFKKLLILFLYLWAVFFLYVLNQALILQQKGVSYHAHGFAVINALVLAKVMLIAEDLKLGDRFNRRSLIVPIAYKASAFAIVFILFHIVEEILVGVVKGRTIAESFPQIGGGSLTGVLCVWGIMFISLAPFFAVTEIGRVIGKEELWNLIFRRGSREYRLTSTPPSVP